MKGQWIFDGVERESGACFLVPVEERDKVTLLNAIKVELYWVRPSLVTVERYLFKIL